MNQLFRRWISRVGRGNQPVTAPRRPRLGVELFEDRVVPATLPNPLVGDAAAITGGYNPQAAIDPLNSNRVVLATTNGTDVRVQYSTDGGLSFQQFFTTEPAPNTTESRKVRDPRSSFSSTKFATTSSPAITFGRDGSIYLVHSESDADKSKAGVIVVHKFDWLPSDTAPTVENLNNDPIRNGFTTRGNVVYRWLNQDPALNPTIAIDNNIPTYTDPVSGAVQTDTMVGKAVYVAWNTNATKPFIDATNTYTFFPNTIVTVASSDGGFNFSNPLTVSNNGYYIPNNAPQPRTAVGPQINFSPTGQAIFTWATLDGHIVTDTSKPDGGNLSDEVVSVYDRRFTTQYTIPDPNNGAGIYSTTTYIPGPTNTDFQALNIDPALMGNTTATTGVPWDVDVGLAIHHNDLSTVKIEFEIQYVEDGTGILKTRKIVLLNNRSQYVVGPNRLIQSPFPGGAAYPTGLPGGTTNLGFISTGGGNTGNAIETTFSDQAPRRINDTNYTPTSDNPGSQTRNNAPNVSPYIGDYTPENGSIDGLFAGLSATEIASIGARLIITDYNDDLPSPAPFTPTLFSWSVQITSRVSKSGFGTDQTAIASATIDPVTGLPVVQTVQGLPNGPDNVHTASPISPAVGLGTVPSMAIDKSLGSKSPYAGRQYIAYTGGTAADPNVYVASRPAGGGNWTVVQVNDDSIFDNFTEGNRPQFMPTVAVDPITGTVVATWYDARFDASGLRPTTYIATSIDGGLTWSSQTYTTNLDYRPYLNQPKTAVDAITGQTTFLEPLPANMTNTAANPQGFGYRQSLIAYDGRVMAYWTGNDNASGTSVYTASAHFAAGPRIVRADMGPVTEEAVAKDEFGNTLYTGNVNPLPYKYNSTLASDGTRQITGFVVVFDRPIDTSTFTAADITVQYRDKNNAVSTITVGAPQVLNGYYTIQNDAAGNPINVPMADDRVFFIPFTTPQSGVGTYSYAISPDVTDYVQQVNRVHGITDPDPAYNGSFDSNLLSPLRIPPLGSGDTGTTTTPAITLPTVADPTQVIRDMTVTINVSHSRVHNLRITLIAPDGTEVLLFNQNGANVTTVGLLGTVFNDSATTAIANGNSPFTGTFRPTESLANLIGKNPAGNWRLRIEDLPEDPSIISLDTGFLLSWSLKITLGQSAVGQGNQMDQDADGVPFEIIGDTFSNPRTILKPGQLADDPRNGEAFTIPYDTQTLPLVIPGPQIVSSAAVGQAPSSDNLFLNSTASAITVTFDRDMNAATFTADDVLRIVGPTGTITSGFTVTPVNARTFTIGFPTQNVSGQYRVELGSDIESLAGDKLDTNRNAVVDFLRGGVPASSTNLPAVSTGVARQIRVTLPSPQTVFGTGITQITGPGGQIYLPSQIQFITPEAGNGTYLITFQTGVTVPSGAYTVTGDFNHVYTTGGGTIAAFSSATFGVNDFTLNIADEYAIQQLIGTNRDLSKLIQLQLNIPSNSLPAKSLTAILLPPGVAGPSNPLDLLAYDPRATILFNGTSLSGAGTNFQNTIFDDSAEANVQSGASPYPTGPLLPQTPLSGLQGIQNGTSSLGGWTLRIINTSNATATLNGWSLSLPAQVAADGLGEPIGDQNSIGFRIFTQNPTDPTSLNTWTPVGASSQNGNGGDNAQSNAGRVTAMAVDPSDPSGNTVYVGGRGSGVWKTTNFLTTDPNGPNWVPLTDLGPTAGLSIASITVFPRMNGSGQYDPNMSMIFALTGSGASGQTGIGILRSLDGGKTWQVLDSMDNSDGAGGVSLISAVTRNRAFVGAAGYKIIADPVLSPTGNVILYMALSNGIGTNGGVWRSTDSGLHWVRMQAGNATDVALSLSTRGADGNAQILYAGIAGDGVRFTSSAKTTLSMSLLGGGQGNNLIQDVSGTGSIPVPVSGPSSTPNGKGRITLITPALTNSPLENSFYAGWLYAAVVATNGQFDGLYLTKDFGANWTKISLADALANANPPVQFTYGTNDETQTQLSAAGSGFSSQMTTDVPYAFTVGNETLALAIDPQDPNVVYLGLGNAIRVDTRVANTPQTFTFDDNSAGGTTGTPQSGTVGGATGRTTSTSNGALRNPNTPATSDTYSTEFLNLSRDPLNPFLTNSTLQVVNTGSFTNNGLNARWMSFDEILGNGLGEDPQVNTITSVVTYVDPLTGQSRVILGTNSGLYSGVDLGDGVISQGIGFAQRNDFSRNGNLQLGEFIAGAVQPSQLAADIAGTLFYAVSQDNGFPVSSPDILATGNNDWTTSALVAIGRGAMVAVDQTGSGTAYEYRAPWLFDKIGTELASDFFRLFDSNANHAGSGIGRTTGLLIAPGDNPEAGSGQWTNLAPLSPANNSGVGRFAVNPIDPNGLLLPSAAGRLYRSTTQGVNWFVVAEPMIFGGSVPRALAFGAPDPNVPLVLNDFIYAGTVNGQIFVTRTGGGTNWTNISTGLDGSTVMQIIPNPRPGTTDAFAITQRGGVYYNANALAAGSSWQKINGNLFSLTRDLFPTNGGTPEKVIALRGVDRNGDGNYTPNDFSEGFGLGLQALAVDWRYEDPNQPISTFPILYVAGDGGVFRSLNGGTTWTFFPSTTDTVNPAPIDGGYLPNMLVTDLDLSIGEVDPTTGMPRTSAPGLNLLVATTYGRGQFAIRLDPTLPSFSFVSGPQVVSVDPDNNDDPSSTTNFNPDRLRITFNGPVDPTTFTPDDVTFLDPSGNPITITAVNMVSVPGVDGSNPQNVFEIRFTTQSAPGTYTLSFGPDISDPAGNRMNQNGNTVNGEPGDAYNRSLLLNTNAFGDLSINGLPANIDAGVAYPITIHSTENVSRDVEFVITDPNATINGAPFVGQTISLDSSGNATVMVMFKQAGAQSLTVRSTDNSLTPSTAATVVAPGEVASFTVAPGSLTAAAGDNVGITVTAFDQFGNIATNFTGMVTLASSGTNPDRGDVMPAPFMLTNGSATVNVQLVTAGERIITATTPITSGVATGSTVPGVTVTAGVATTLTVLNGPATAVAGTSQNYIVAATDIYGNTDSGFTGAIDTTSSDLNALITSPIALVNGQATIPVTFQTSGSQTLNFSAGGAPFVATSVVAVDAAPATHYSVVAGVPTSNAGNMINVTVTALDQFGNVDKNYSGLVMLTTPGDPQSTVPAPFVLTSGVGVQAITLRTAGVQTISATDTVTSTINGTTSVTVNPGSLSQYTVTGPTSVVTGTPTQYTVSAADQFGNPITGYNGNARIETSDIEGTIPNTVSIINGVGSFTALLRTFGNQTLTVTDLSFSTVTGTVTIDITPVPVVPPPPPPVVPPPPVSPPGPGGGGNGTTVPPPSTPLGNDPASQAPIFTVGLGAGVMNRVQVFDQSGQLANQFTAYEQGFAGGVRSTPVRTPNKNFVVTVPGPGRQIDVRVIDPVTGLPVQSFLPFEVSFTGGAFVSTADLDRDGYDDYVITPDEGGGPRVKIISGRTGATILDFFGIDDPNFRGGARSAMGDINGDGIPDLVVAAGFGGGPRVAVWDGASILAGRPTRLTADFFAFEPALRNGVYVAVGDMDGDGKAEIITGAGPGGGPRIIAFSGDALLQNQQVPLVDFFAGNVDNRGGIRVAAVNLDNDDLIDLVVGDGELAGSRVTGYLGTTIRQSSPPAATFGFDDLPGFTGGVFVG
ncbi:MAG: proprotein convertase P-domain-containing protein [Bacteroidales bacterium]|nr:proprotein convertase P-domain-containing protein [Bacteroidales bacterium]